MTSQRKILTFEFVLHFKSGENVKTHHLSPTEGKEPQLCLDSSPWTPEHLTRMQRPIVQALRLGYVSDRIGKVAHWIYAITLIKIRK